MSIKCPVNLDHHATTPCDPAVVEAMLPYFSDFCGNTGARNHRGRVAAKAVNEAKEQMAELIGAVPEALTLTSGATEANTLALLGIAAIYQTIPGKRREILISAFEHPSVTKTVYTLVERGFTVREIPVTPDGFVKPQTLKDMVSDRTLLVSVMAVNHEIGTIQPIRELAEIAHEVGALFHSDATQGAGKIPLSVGETDLLSFSSHKIYGPQGIGALYVRPKPPMKFTAIMVGSGQQTYRSGTIPAALAVGFGKACQIAGQRMESDRKHLQELADLLFFGLRKKVPSLQVNGSLTSRLPGSLNIRIPGVGAEDILLALADDLCLSMGAACGTGKGRGSPVLKAIGLSNEEAAESIRVSPGRSTTQEDIQFAVEKLADSIAMKAAA